MPLPNDPFFDYFQHLKSLPDHVLRDIARNDCAEFDYRKQAVEVLVVRKSPLANHPELREFRDVLDAELDGLQFEYPAESEFIPKTVTAGPLTASVTTKTMFGEAPSLVTEIKKTEPSPNFPDAPPSESVHISQTTDPEEITS
jgi:hypothetical protein